MDEFEDFIGSEMQPFISILQDNLNESEVTENKPVTEMPVVSSQQLTKTKKYLLWRRIITLWGKEKNK
ncbi:MAG: hypothetical protein DHS20C18_49480 [Saprospiraceae bacterium]|nr:MAG: hypothetical protein DHS20C18_49480 [Saprospiraceae bacterium]